MGNPSDKAGTVIVDGRFMASRIAHVVALSGGLGLLPKAPGTFGALAGLAIGWGLQFLPLVPALAVIAALGAVGIWACGATAHAAGVHDHQAIVMDETWAMAAVVVLSPPGWAWLIAGFLAFRMFDIVKPWPINWIDARVEGGLGIMADDGAAAVLAILMLQALAWSSWISV